MADTSDLPIVAVLPELAARLAENANAVLVAPPGAGKTSMVAPWLLDQPWCSGQILLLSPRRLTARAAAERMAELAGEQPGETIGYQTRMDSRTSARTRVIVLTEGIFVNRIQADPELAGVSAVLFDEVHERSMDGDFGLALALEAQAAFRPDLRLLAMSATLDGERFASLMGQGDDAAPVVSSEGRMYPLELRHVGRRSERPVEVEMAATIRKALADEAKGDVLAFLPGMAEIERTATALLDLPEHIVLHRLYGALLPAEQRAAIRPDPDGRRKIILATSIAETSLTIDGVRIVIDSGLARRPRYDRAAGTTRLVTERASRAAVIQRAGRAARQGPGVAYRLWEEAAIAGFPTFDPPEILESDLTSLVLQCASWGEHDPRRLRWLDAPPDSALEPARARLLALEAINHSGTITAHGQALAALPMDPAMAHMMLVGADRGSALLAGEIAVLLQERGLGGQGEDLDARLSRWRSDRSPRAEAARRLARRWAERVASDSRPDRTGQSPGLLLAAAYPERLARRRDSSGEDWQSVGGRGFRLDARSPLASAEWLAVGDVLGQASGARILSAFALDNDQIESAFADRIEKRNALRYVLDKKRVEARIERRLGAIRLSTAPDPSPDPVAVAACLMEAVREHRLDLIDWGDAARRLRNRAAYAGNDALSDATLIERLEEWLAPLLAGIRNFDDLDRAALQGALTGLLGWDAAREIDRLAPAEFASPAGTRHPIEYAASAGPTVSLRVQALYGLAEHPTIGRDRVPLVLELTSPAGRAIQTTRDLPGFWAGSWADVVKDMRGRYPRHNWPDDPAKAAASLKTKRAQGL